MSEDLGMGTTEESFHLVGNVPKEIDSLVTGAAVNRELSQIPKTVHMRQRT